MKKRFLALLMALAIVMSMFSVVTVSASAKDVSFEVVANEELSDYEDWKDPFEDAILSEDEMYYYTLENSNATIVYYLEEAMPSDFTVPETIDGYPVVAIGDEAFSYSSGGKNLTIHDGIVSIGNEAFYCTDIKTLNIGSGVQTIGDAAFAGCEGLADINVDANNTSFVVADEVLYTKDMKTLVQYPIAKDEIEFEIPSTVTKIGDSAFELSKLESIVIPSNVIEIDSYAFYDCFSLEEVILNENLQRIGEGAFEFTCIETVTIPASVTSIEVSAFDDIACLAEINVNSANMKYRSQNGILFSKDMKEFIKYPEGKTATTYTIPDSVETLKEYAFNFVTLESITIPDTVVNFEEDIFLGSEEITIICSKNSKAAEYAEEYYLNVQYTEEVLATSLKLNATTIKWPVGKSGRFKPTVLPAEASQKLEWKSSNPKVATVDANGKLTAVAIGTAVITCKTTDGSNLSATCNVTVGKLVSEVKLNVSSLTWGVGRSGSFKPTVSPADAANKSLTWTSSNSKVATVDANGKLTAVGVGTATITCKAADGSGKSATCKVTVKDIASSLKLNATTIKWPVGKSGNFKPTVSPAKHANQKLSWSSSNTKVATVSSTGKLTAVGIGTATITCKTTDGSNLKATCNVTVGKAVTSVKLNCSSLTWATGKSGSFKPTVAPSDAINKSLTWTSSNPSVATVDANGKLTTLKEGTTTITCKAKDGSGKYATCKVTVSNKITSLKLNASSIVWEVGKAGSFKPTVTPSGVSTSKLSWTSLNPDVATVSSTGKLTAKAPGTATIICETTDGSNLYATCRVMVTKGSSFANYRSYFNKYFKDGTYAINGTTSMTGEDGKSYSANVQLGISPTADYMSMSYTEDGVKIKLITNPDEMVMLYPSFTPSKHFDSDLSAAISGFPKQYYYQTKNYYEVLAELDGSSIGLDDLTYKSENSKKYSGTTYLVETFEKATGGTVEYYFYNGTLNYLNIINDGESTMIKVSSLQGTFKTSDFDVPSGYIEVKPVVIQTMA